MSAGAVSDRPAQLRRPTDTRESLAAATVDAAVFELRPEYRALLLTADRLRGASDAGSEALLADAETAPPGGS